MKRNKNKCENMKNNTDNRKISKINRKAIYKNVNLS